jgi:hypothetical protein
MKRLAHLLVFAPLAAFGCTDAPIVLPRAIVDVDVTPMTSDPTRCQPAANDLVTIGCAGRASRCAGNDADGLFLPVTHGSAISNDGRPNDTGIEVHVYCTIVSTANAFDVKVSALRVDPNNPARNTQKLTLYGVIAPSRTPQPVTVKASNTNIASFNNGEKGCTISFPNEEMGIASGRLWARLDCPDAIIPTQEPRACNVSGIIRFENCGE